MTDERSLYLARRAVEEAEFALREAEIALAKLPTNGNALARNAAQLAFDEARLKADRMQSAGDFDVWLAAVRAAAWEEGFQAGMQCEEDAYWQPGVPEKHNPHLPIRHLSHTPATPH